MNVLAFLAKQSDQSKNGNTILHILAQRPTSETSLDFIMDLLQFGFKPSLKNKAGQNFLDGSTIKDHLLQRIQSAPENWTDGLMRAWIDNIGGEEPNSEMFLFIWLHNYTFLDCLRRCSTLVFG